MPIRFNVPPLSRALLLFLIALTSVNMFIRYREWVPHTSPAVVPYITIVPNQSYKFPWVVASAALAEQNIFSLIASGLTIYFGGRYLERAWGSSEYAKFVLFVVTIPNLLSFFTYLFWYLLGGNTVRS